MIYFDGVTVSYGEHGEQTVLSSCSLHIPAGGHVALMGPSGCGKTTLLRLAAGLQLPDSGRVTVNGRISCAFQEPRLLPWLTAEQNLALVLLKYDADRVREYLENAGLADSSGKYPDELSGGMKQRINLCRALAYDADTLLLDEPFQGLDGDMRRKMADLIAREASGRTLLLVTHMREEAELLCDTILEYNGGSFS